MKKKDVTIGGLYLAKVSDRLTEVRIDSTHSAEGWNATNTRTGKRIRIKSAQRLREPAGKKAGGGRPQAGGKATDEIRVGKRPLEQTRRPSKAKAGKVQRVKGSRAAKAKGTSRSDSSGLKPPASGVKLSALDAAA